jgi:hypothetical protein
MFLKKSVSNGKPYPCFAASIHNDIIKPIEFMGFFMSSFLNKIVVKRSETWYN